MFAMMFCMSLQIPSVVTYTQWSTCFYFIHEGVYENITTACFHTHSRESPDSNVSHMPSTWTSSSLCFFIGWLIREPPGLQSSDRSMIGQRKVIRIRACLCRGPTLTSVEYVLFTYKYMYIYILICFLAIRYGIDR